MQELIELMESMKRFEKALNNFEGFTTEPIEQNQVKELQGKIEDLRSEITVHIMAWGEKSSEAGIIEYLKSKELIL